ncbi:MULTISPECIES: lysophospholipase L2 [Pantoea]|uniref:Lysophospholipase L2 n=1 Tax=Candidatus Pantoea multigeneris TaxID=2608357 RepID=A0ABX0RGU2_9GAMM|nr:MULTISPECIES: lysophospholipase L2 [Pantoea]NIF24526.1 lysophospholipase L2 [Pantoea multigeneris]
MHRHKASWLTRERAFSAFATGPLLDFWRTREEREFTGVGNLTLRYVRFTAPKHKRVILIVPGRIESYVKYPELAYDLFHCGYDVVILDHRGQGRSDRLLEDPHRGHVMEFSHYVDDLETLYLQEIVTGHYQQRYALAHSMGGAILTLFLARQPQAFHAAALIAPMFGIALPLPTFLATRILDWAEKRPAMRDAYAMGTGRWRANPFGENHLTHSVERYRRNVRFYSDDPALRVGGPTYHWVREGVHAGKSIISQAEQITTPMLLLQSSEDEVVDNRAQDLFCDLMREAGHPCEGGKPRVIKGAYHEILFEKDAMRAEALHAVTDFFQRHR